MVFFNLCHPSTRNSESTNETSKADATNLECPLVDDEDKTLRLRYSAGQCSICLENLHLTPKSTMLLVVDAESLLTTRLRTGNELAKLPCEHCFHANELVEWFTRKLPTPSCPVCRHPVALGNLEVKLPGRYGFDYPSRWARLAFWLNRMVMSLITCDLVRQQPAAISNGVATRYRP